MKLIRKLLGWMFVSLPVLMLGVIFVREAGLMHFVYSVVATVGISILFLVGIFWVVE